MSSGLVDLARLFLMLFHKKCRKNADLASEHTGLTGYTAYMFHSPCGVTLHVLDTVMVGPSTPTLLIVPLCMEPPHRDPGFNFTRYRSLDPCPYSHIITLSPKTALAFYTEFFMTQCFLLLVTYPLDLWSQIVSVLLMEGIHFQCTVHTQHGLRHTPRVDGWQTCQHFWVWSTASTWLGFSCDVTNTRKEAWAAEVLHRPQPM